MDEATIAAALGMLQGVGSQSVIFSALLALLNQEIPDFKPRMIAILRQAKHADLRGQQMIAAAIMLIQNLET